MSNSLKLKNNEVSFQETNKKMIDVIIATLPAVAAGIYFYRMDAVKILLASIITSVLCEIIWNYGKDKKIKLRDFSSIVTGVLFALILPNHLPVWIVIIGSIFANVFVKNFFGGLGGNFMNPSAVAKVFLITSWAGIMAKPVSDSADATVKATTLMDKFLGSANGNIGETSVLALLIGFIYLLIRGIISYRSTLSYLASFALFNWILGRNGFFIGDYSKVINGAVFLAAVFMSNDYVTTPKQKLGQVAFGFLAGFLASIITIYGYNPDGPYYAVIIINLTTPLIDYLTTPKDLKEVV